MTLNTIFFSLSYVVVGFVCVAQLTTNLSLRAENERLKQQAVNQGYGMFVGVDNKKIFVWNIDLEEQIKKENAEKRITK